MKMSSSNPSSQPASPRCSARVQCELKFDEEITTVPKSDFEEEIVVHMKIIPTVQKEKFRKSTSQHAISTIEKEMAKNLIFMQKKEFDTRNTNNATEALFTKEDLNVNGFQRTMMMKRITEQITDISRGNTAALVVIEQFVLFEIWHSDDN